MVDFDLFLESKKEKIDIQKYIKNLELPSRILHILEEKDYATEDHFLESLNRTTLEYTSHYLFPNKWIAFYPQMIKRHATHDTVCNISGAIIKKGSLYYTYHPFMEDLENGKVYTIKKKISVEYAFIDYFPKDLFTYEEWYYRIKNAYYEENDSIIDFYNLSISCGENCLEPYALGPSKKRKKVKL